MLHVWATMATLFLSSLQTVSAKIAKCQQFVRLGFVTCILSTSFVVLLFSVSLHFELHWGSAGHFSIINNNVLSSSSLNEENSKFHTFYFGLNELWNTDSNRIVFYFYARLCINFSTFDFRSTNFCVKWVKTMLCHLLRMWVDFHLPMFVVVVAFVSDRLLWHIDIDFLFFNNRKIFATP